MRNFLLEAKVDGRQTDIRSGPRNKEGGMSIKIFQRSEGESKEVATITCKLDGEILSTEIETINSQRVIQTRR